MDANEKGKAEKIDDSGKTKERISGTMSEKSKKAGIWNTCGEVCPLYEARCFILKNTGTDWRGSFWAARMKIFYLVACIL